MEMFLMPICLSLFGLAVTCLAFGAATRSEQPPAAPPAKPETVPLPSARFFVSDAVIPAPPETRVPIEALLLQIENHIRLEQAAAESFMETPTSALLHSRTISTLVN